MPITAPPFARSASEPNSAGLDTRPINLQRLENLHHLTGHNLRPSSSLRFRLSALPTNSTS